ncbi:putative methyltransferase-domain-containing protein [Peziza echinospora]|nr:putative methyltransferase-domain-containing protein [Peziza echinospora]
MNLFNDSDSEVEPLSESFVPTAPRLDARITETTFDGLLSPPLRLHEDLARGCGGQIWPAGNTLAKYVLRNFSNDGLRGKRIIEIGAGGGLVGLAMASAFRKSDYDLYLTDQEPMMELMRQNTDLNGLNVNLEILNWGEPLPKFAESPVDIVLAADCVYYEPAFPLLEKTLLDLAGENTTVLFCHKKRRRADLRFMKSIKKKLHFVEIKDYPEYEESSRESVFLFDPLSPP